MTEPPQDRELRSNSHSPLPNARTSIRATVGFAVVVAIAILIGVLAKHRSRTHSSTTATTSAPPAVAATTEAESDLSRRATETKTPASIPASTSEVRVAVSDALSEPLAPPSTPRPEPSPYARELVASLYQLDLSEGRPSPEQAAQWQTNLAQLIQQGAPGVAAIREFLEKNLDYDFLAVGGENLFGYASMRTALFDALRQIGGPEALDLTLQTLRATAEPREIALLAGSLEQQAPGQYREMTLEVARKALALVGSDKLEGVDAAPLFEVLQRFGGPGVVTDLQGAAAKWNYYAKIALAQLPDGAGVPALIEMAAANPSGTAYGNRNFTLEVLAHIAPGSAEARSALLDQARQNQIPDDAWPSIADALAGRDTGFLKAVLGEKPPGRVSGSKWYHIAFGNQHFYSVPSSTGWSDARVNEHVALINQFLAGNPNPAAVAALQDARAAVLNRKMP